MKLSCLIARVASLQASLGSCMEIEAKAAKRAGFLATSADYNQPLISYGFIRGQHLREWQGRQLPLDWIDLIIRNVLMKGEYPEDRGQ